MFSKSFLFFGKNDLLNIRHLLEKNDTLFSSTSKFNTQKNHENLNKSDENESSTLFGIPTLLIILACIFIMAILICIIILMCYYKNRFRSKGKENEQKKENNDKNIELSQTQKDDNCGHIIISSFK